METKNQIPIGMLITQVTFFPDESAEIFGFWYYKEKTLPETREERKLIGVDYGIGRCCKLRIMGSAKQIEGILFSSDWNPSSRDIGIRNTKELVKRCRKHAAIPFEIDREDKPKGIAIPMDLVIRVKQDLASVLRKLCSGYNKISLDLAPDWDLGEEIDSYLNRLAN